MIMTPEQAAATWCPMVRAARIEEIPAHASNFTGKITAENPSLTIVAGCNMDALGRHRAPASCRCIANKCAMWRWAPPGELAAEVARGYCGLAGAPLYAQQDQRIPF